MDLSAICFSFKWPFFFLFHTFLFLIFLRLSMMHCIISLFFPLFLLPLCFSLSYLPYSPHTLISLAIPILSFLSALLQILSFPYSPLLSISLYPPFLLLYIRQFPLCFLIPFLRLSSPLFNVFPLLYWFTSLTYFLSSLRPHFPSSYSSYLRALSNINRCQIETMIIKLLHYNYSAESHRVLSAINVLYDGIHVVRYQSLGFSVWVCS